MHGLETNLKSTRPRPGHYKTKTETSSKRPRPRPRPRPRKLVSKPVLRPPSLAHNNINYECMYVMQEIISTKGLITGS